MLPRVSANLLSGLIEAVAAAPRAASSTTSKTTCPVTWKKRCVRNQLVQIFGALFAYDNAHEGFSLENPS
jgi:hypothetical protein